MSLGSQRKAFLAAAALVCFATAAAQTSHWLDVPFVSQPENGCGAAVISMTLQYWNAHGAAIADSSWNVSTIQQKLYSPGDRGIKASAMTAYFESLGFRAFAFEGDVRDLESHIAKGRPLIVALRQSKDVLHYAVVVGTDAAGNAVLVNDPARRKLLKIDSADFQKQWSGAAHWTLLVLPKTVAAAR